MLENITSLKVQGGYFVDETDDFPLFQNTINILYGRNGSGKSSIFIFLPKPFDVHIAICSFLLSIGIPIKTSSSSSSSHAFSR